MSDYPVFQIPARDGIVVVRRINFIRNPNEKLYGVTDKDIYEHGFLNFNYHPHQWGGQNHGFNGFPGTKISGLPVMLMEDLKRAESMISMGG